jgi:TolA-binding protein
MIKALMVAIAAALMCGCVSVSSRFDDVKRQNTPAAYEQFVKQYPQSEFAREARDRLEGLYFDEAKAKGTIAAFEQYLARYPRGRLAAEAQDRLEALYFDGAKAKGGIAAFEQYLARYPRGRLAVEARGRLEALYFDEAKAKGAIAAFEQYLARYPKGRFAQDARDNLQGLYFGKMRIEFQWSESAQKSLQQSQTSELEACVKQSLEKGGTRIVPDTETPKMVVSYDQRPSAKVAYDYDGSKLVQRGTESVVNFTLQFSLVNSKGENVFSKAYKGEAGSRSVPQNMGQVTALPAGGVPFEAIKLEVQKQLQGDPVHLSTRR